MIGGDAGHSLLLTGTELSDSTGKVSQNRFRRFTRKLARLELQHNQWSVSCLQKCKSTSENLILVRH